MVMNMYRVVVAVILLSVGQVTFTAPPANAATDRLPDLGMAQLRDFRIETVNGRRVLRFTTIIVNVGSGQFEVDGTRASTSQAEMTTQQRIYDTAGTSRLVPTPAQMFFAGDGHTHWHVRNLETYEMTRLDNGNKVGTGAKTGFCFYDNYAYRLALPGAPQSPFYRGCGAANDLAVNMGLSVGWGDQYHYSLPDQFIDITTLSPGHYRLTATADNFNWFLESNDTNNATWVDIQIKSTKGSSFKILGYGPSA